MPRVPGAAGQVGFQGADRPLFHAGRQARPYRLSGTDGLVKVRFRPRPVGLEEPVGAVGGNGDRLNTSVAEKLGDPGDRGEAPPVVVDGLGQDLRY